jgi:hypothetical protein
MTPMPRGMQMRSTLPTRMVTRVSLLLLFVPLPYSTATGFQSLVRWKRMRPLSLMGFGRDLITSPYSPALLHATLHVIEIAIFLFAQWADSQMLENPSSTIRLDDWRSLKSDGGDLSALLSLLNAECALACRPAVEPRDLDSNFLGHNLCNKTDVDSISSPPLIRPGTAATAATAATCCTSPRKHSLAQTLSSHPNIHTMFPTMQARMPAKVAVAQVMEANIALQETEEAT